MSKHQNKEKQKEKGGFPFKMCNVDAFFQSVRSKVNRLFPSCASQFTELQSKWGY